MNAYVKGGRAPATENLRKNGRWLWVGGGFCKTQRKKGVVGGVRRLSKHHTSLAHILSHGAGVEGHLSLEHLHQHLPDDVVESARDGQRRVSVANHPSQPCARARRHASRGFFYSVS